eukprot:13354677-Alexandrium_andersonii.AAC.1
MAEIRERELQRRRARTGGRGADDAVDSDAGFAPCFAPSFAPDTSLAQPAASAPPSSGASAPETAKPSVGDEVLPSSPAVAGASSSSEYARSASHPSVLAPEAATPSVGAE